MSQPKSDNEYIENYGTLVSNHQLHMTLAKAVSRGDQTFNIVRPTLLQLLQGDAWRDRIDPLSGQRFQRKPHEFRRYIEEPIPGGLGITIERIRKFLGDSTPERLAFEAAIVGGRGASEGDSRNPKGVNQHSERINPNDIRVNPPVGRDEPSSSTIPIRRVESPPKPKRNRSDEPQAGTSIGYAVRRLKRETEDGNEAARVAYERFTSGQITAYAAMVEAGFAARRVSIPLEPKEAAAALVKHFCGDRLMVLIRELASRVTGGNPPSEEPSHGRDD